MNIKETLLDLYSRQRINRQALEIREKIFETEAEKEADQKYQWLMMERRVITNAINEAEEVETKIACLNICMTRLAILDKCRDNPLLEDNE